MSDSIFRQLNKFALRFDGPKGVFVPTKPAAKSTSGFGWEYEADDFEISPRAAGVAATHELLGILQEIMGAHVPGLQRSGSRRLPKQTRKLGVPVGV